jgi:S-DNA-T family DNA segregation ATPase FtsK/SpoIIIE
MCAWKRPFRAPNYIGIEVPNKLVSTVSLREVLDSPEMKANPSPLLVALGKDIAGSPVLCDLSKMPHLLIAGATGSGKSVCINSIVCSLLYRTTPEQVRLIMVDPKQVELSVYNTIPHLLVPVVSDPKKAAGALSWVVQEMLERYGKFSAQGVRNLAGYNKANQGTDKVLPNIVVIIDEMADLMEVCRKDVEESIRRLAALARAAGIYMVLATQRPSVDVITGVIKNNIPSRIAFAVSSGTDSRTIIDINGAEKLMGKGDMLYKPTGASPTRVQGCFVSDEEVNAIADFIGSRYQTDFDPNIVEHLESTANERSADEITSRDDDPGAGGGEGSFQELLQQAIEMAVEDGQTSTSMLQRRLRVGYARAGRLIDEMEKRNIISQSEGSKPRKTLITREQYAEMMQDN